MVEEILPNVYDITVSEDAGRRYRAFLVEAEVPTLIDAGLAATTETLFDGIAEVGIEPERLVLTHGDPDHVGGFDAVAKRYDVETWVPEQTEADIEPPDNRYVDGDAIGPFEAFDTLGHAVDHHALVDEGAGLLVAGDALFGADLRGLPAGYLTPPPALYSEDVNRAEESMERLLEYDFDAALVFHGSSVTDGAYDLVDAFVNFPGKPESASYR